VYNTNYNMTCITINTNEDKYYTPDSMGMTILYFICRGKKPFMKANDTTPHKADMFTD